MATHTRGTNGQSGYDETPQRSYMDDPNNKWKTVKPDYTLANKKYLSEKTMSHPEGSLEKIVENLVKTWEMESTHKIDKKDWGSIDHEVYRISVNGGRLSDIEDNIERGNYNLLMEDGVLYKAKQHTNESSHTQFKNTFSEGFPWELLEVYSGPPKVAFKWRHWAKWTGKYEDQEPTGETLEMFGITIATVNEQLKIQKLEVFFDYNPFIAKLMGLDQNAKGCPFHCNK